eukprot:1147439-Pelagomonas_calceolata.AAC.4
MGSIDSPTHTQDDYVECDLSTLKSLAQFCVVAVKTECKASGCEGSPHHTSMLREQPPRKASKTQDGWMPALAGVCLNQALPKNPAAFDKHKFYILVSFGVLAEAAIVD